ncbi:MAG: hypothetical protein AAF488_15160 [Planctomycetota bacterium]
MPLLRFIYCHNPFYLASAALVFFGSQSLFAEGTAWSAGPLFAFLGTYTLLLVAAGVAIVRWGRIWEDARSIFMVVLVLWVALSASFDELLLDNTRTGCILLALGLVLSIASSEFALRATGLPLSRGYRLPFHGLMALFFVYPLVPVLLGPRSVAADVSVALFAPIVAIGYLAFVPALERGSHAVRQDAPWRFPFYPWIPLLLLLPCGVVRGRSLCLAFGSGIDDATIFAPYLIAPALFVIGALLELGGRRHGRAMVRHVALAFPAVAIALSVLPELNTTQREFFDRSAVLGAPAQWTAIGSALFYAWTMRRRSPAADALLAASIVVWGSLAVDPSSAGVHVWSSPTALSLSIATAVIALGWRGSVVHRVATGFLGIAALGASGWGSPSSGLPTLYVASQAGLVWLWAVSRTVNTREAAVLRATIAVAIPPSVWAALNVAMSSPTDVVARSVPVIAATSWLALQGYWTYRYRTRLHTTMLLASVTVLLGRAALELRHWSAAALRVAGGLALFAVGIGVSVAKIRAGRTGHDPPEPPLTLERPPLESGDGSPP